MSLIERAQDMAMNESPAANSLFLRSIFTFGSVRPWLLCTVMAYARHIGSCTREHVPFFPSQLRFMGAIGTTSSPSKVFTVDPLYVSNLINTAIGSDGGPFPSNMMSTTVLIDPFTNPVL